MQNRSKTNWQESLKNWSTLTIYPDLKRYFAKELCMYLSINISYKVVNIISCECIHSIRLRWTSPNESQANRWSWPGNVMESWLFKPLSLSVSVILTQTEEWEGGVYLLYHIPPYPNHSSVVITARYCSLSISNLAPFCKVHLHL